MTAAAASVMAFTEGVRPAAASAATKAQPCTYTVSTEPGVFPEGVAVTGDGTIYVTSLGTGAIYRGSTTRPTMEVFLPGGLDGRAQAAGIHLDKRGRLFVAGYATGALFVYSEDGRLLAKRVAPADGATLNDLVIVDDAVYVTDTMLHMVWRVQLSGSRIGELEPWLVPADFPVPPGYLNGIVVTADKRFLLVADQGTDQPGYERLYRVDQTERQVTVVAVTGGQMGADGLLLEGRRLYGVVNFPNSEGGWSFATNLAILTEDYAAAAVVGQSQPATMERSPTTLARVGDRLLWVNSQLASPSPAPPFVVTEVPGLA